MGAVLVAAGVLVAGCGGSGGGSATAPTSGSSASSSSPAPSPAVSTSAATSPATGGTAAAKAAFLAKANAVCARMNKASDALPSPPNTPAGLATFLDRQLLIMDTAVDRLRALTPPPGEEATVRGLLAQIDALNRTVGRASAALRAGDTATAGRLLQQVGTRTPAVNRAFTAYGLTVCGED